MDPISSWAHRWIIVAGPEIEGDGLPEVWETSLALSGVLRGRAKATNQDCLSFRVKMGDSGNVKTIPFILGRSSPRKNLLFRNFPVGDESHGKDVDDRRAVVAGVGGDDGQEG